MPQQHSSQIKYPLTGSSATGYFLLFFALLPIPAVAFVVKFFFGWFIDIVFRFETSGQFGNAAGILVFFPLVYLALKFLAPVSGAYARFRLYPDRVEFSPLLVRFWQGKLTIPMKDFTRLVMLETGLEGEVYYGLRLEHPDPRYSLVLHRYIETAPRPIEFAKQIAKDSHLELTKTTRKDKSSREKEEAERKEEAAS